MYVVALVVVITISIFTVCMALKNKKQLIKSPNAVDENVHQVNINKMIQYLEFSIIGGNNPFKNYNRGSDFTLLSYMRLKHIKNITEQIINSNIEGDILEAGNWRGGGMLYAKGIIDAYGVKNKDIWMFDTFCGFPRNATVVGNYENNLVNGPLSELMRSNSVEKVKSLFNVYNLSTGVHFVAGLFQDTIKSTKIPKLSYLRLDADSYTNTMFLLENLYDKLNKNGYIEFDDYGAYKGCKKAVDEFRSRNNINTPIEYLYEHPGRDKYYEAVYWVK